MRIGPTAARALQAIGRELLAASRQDLYPAAATRRQSAVALITYWGFLVALVGTLVAGFGLNFNSVSGASWAGWARLGVGALLVAVGLLLVSDWQRARRLLVRRLYERAHARDRARPSRIRLWLWRPLGPALLVVGMAWVAVGSFEIAQALRSLL